MSGGSLLPGSSDLICKPAGAIQDVDCGVVAGLAELPGQDDMSIQDGTDFFCNRVITVIIFREDGIECSD